ncbi:sialin-like isoform X2 [Anthonomus grandis grandis]|uniref:sialin-like isoform X2 n=1 Tax=Anthonomus grandis grandis TaxID=2921223 RepID=UPI0021662266|nr:sialin-like isoform X2 [Anthonomus grandis grandis]
MREKTCCPIRYVMMVMVFMTTYINYTTRSNLSISLPAMVIPGGHDKHFVPECKREEAATKKHEANSTTTAKPIEEDTGEKFDWDETVQGQLLGGYFYGYLLGSLPGGMVAENLGPVWTIFGATLISGILNSVCVWIAPVHWAGLMVVRFLIGLGLVYPALQTLIGRWAVPQERTVFVACLMGNTLGTSMTWVIGGIVTRAYKWPWGFHIFSLQIVIFLVVFYLCSGDRPDEHRFIGEQEVNFIKECQAGTVKKTKGIPPFKEIFLSFPFWTLCILHWGNLWGLYTQLICVPKFMKEYIGQDIKKSGVFSSLPSFARLILGFGFGFLGDFLKRKKYKRIIILKGFLFVSHIIPGILMGLLTLAKCDATAAIVMLTFSMSLNGAVVVTNLANPTDLSPNFAGTIFGIISFIGGVTGFIVPSLMGALLNAFGNNSKSWSLVFGVGGAVYTGCGIFFLIFGTATTQPWNDKEEKPPETETT